MKKVTSILLGALLLFSLTACDVSEQKITENSGVEITVAGDAAEFIVTADKTEIVGETERVGITVKAVAKRDLHIKLGTGSYKEEGAIRIECHMLQGETEYLLYDNLYGMNVTHDTYEFDFKKGSVVARSLKFSRFPVEYSEETTKTVPKGKYRVRVKLSCDTNWSETEISINAK